MLPLRSREYKVVLDHRQFADRDQATRALWAEVQATGMRIEVDTAGEFSKTKRRWIEFLDTEDGAIAANGLVLRRRIEAEEGESEYTLKCRSPDRYVAAGIDVTPVGSQAE